MRTPTDRKPLRVLVMDDQEIMREIMTLMLERLGHETSAVDHGEAAITEMERAEHEGRPYDAALLDLTIPGGMGGLKVAEVARQRGLSTKLFACSGYGLDPAMERPSDHGFTDSIEKPGTSKTIGAVLDRHFPRT